MSCPVVGNILLAVRQAIGTAFQLPVSEGSYSAIPFWNLGKTMKNPELPCISILLINIFITITIPDVSRSCSCIFTFAGSLSGIWASGQWFSWQRLGPLGFMPSEGFLGVPGTWGDVHK